MEVKMEISSSGLTAKSDEAPDSYRVVASVSENANPVQIGGRTLVINPPPAPATTAPAAAPAATSAVVAPPAGLAISSLDGKKKRGRPKKYGPDGVALSPMPISASIPLTGDFTGWQQSRGTPVEPVKKKRKFEVESPGEKVACFFGANFTPHVLTVNPGEDVTMKIISFSQQGSQAVCVLSAIGTVSSVSLRQSTSSGGTLTYEGCFEILSLSGSYMPIESGGTISRSGGMSVSLAGPDGRVVGGGLAGLLVAAGPVQVVVGRFLTGHQAGQNPKKHRVEAPSVLTSVALSNPIIREETSGSYGVTKPIISTISPSNGGSTNLIHDSRTSVSEQKICFTTEHSNGLS